MTLIVLFFLNQTFTRLILFDQKVNIQPKGSRNNAFSKHCSVTFGWRQFKRSRNGHQHIHFCEVRKALSYDVKIVKIAYVVEEIWTYEILTTVQETTNRMGKCIFQSPWMQTIQASYAGRSRDEHWSMTLYTCFTCKIFVHEQWGIGVIL